MQTEWPDWANFRLMGECYFVHFFDNYSRSPKYVFGATFSSVKVMHSFWRKLFWATFWAIFSQTHPVTLSCKWDSVSSWMRIVSVADISVYAWPFLERLIHGDNLQGDRMRLWKNRPKCSPKHFSSKLMHNFFPWKRVPQTFVLFK
jgi:hypothetical protein